MSQEQVESQEQIEETQDNNLENLSDEEFENWLNDNTSTTNDSTDTNTTNDNTDTVEENQEQEQEQEPTEEVDYKAFYESITSPFKANGKEIKITNAQDVISMMQQGANYTKKMQELAPMRKAAESLIKAGIDYNQLAFLIDVNKGNKEAIKKLLKDKNFDITDIDLDEESSYQVNYNNIATDQEIEYRDALQDSTPERREKMQKIIESWDTKSQNAILNNPNLLRGLDWEIATGRYDKIKEIMESEKMFGRYKGGNDLDFVRYIATEMDKQLIREQQQATNTSNSRPVPQSNTDKRKAAPSKGRPTPTKSSMTPEDLMGMSDEDFLKLNEKDFY